MDKLVSLLKERNLTISCAESLTGGLFASSITNVSGASNVFKGGVVSYTNEIKEKVLGVEKNVLDNEGAISYECCKQMANNVKSIFNTDIGVSFTGNAGPSANENKPVGLVYIGISYSCTLPSRSRCSNLARASLLLRSIISRSSSGSFSKTTA